MIRVLSLVFSIALALTVSLFPLQAGASQVGVVVMHGKGGNPGKHVNGLAYELEHAGFLVANLEMPWSARRHYDVDMNGAANEITAALAALRAQGAQKVFVAGHSQGGLFALYYGGRHAVDGLIAIAPGGQVDADSFVKALGQHVSAAKAMVDAGRGDETASFGDFEGSRGTNTVATTAAIYLNWFDPNGAHTTRAFKNVKVGIPVLYVGPKQDYPGLIAGKRANFGSLPQHPLTRLYEPESSHLAAPSAAAEEIVQWVKQVAGR